MLHKFKIHLTLVCTLATGSLLCLMAVFFLTMYESQTHKNTLSAFQASQDTVILRLQTEQMINWVWLRETENSGNLMIFVEDNGSPLLFNHSSQSRIPDSLISDVKAKAAEMGVSTDQKPESILTPETVVFHQRMSGLHYLASVSMIPAGNGFRCLILLKDLRGQDLIIWQRRMLFTAVIVSGMAALAAFSWWFCGRAVKAVEDNQKQQREFIAAASHELRSPLAVIRTSASALAYEATETGQAFTAAIERECARTSRLVDDLLMLANADAAKWNLRLAKVLPETILFEVYEAYHPMAKEKGCELSILIPDEELPIIQADPQRISQVLGILLDNALRFTPAGGKIHLQAGAVREQIRLIIQDTGQGMPEDVKRHAFDRFYKGDAARAQKEHYGLGLSIAWEIIQLHHGKIRLLDTPGGGLTVELSIPAKRFD